MRALGLRAHLQARSASGARARIAYSGRYRQGGKPRTLKPGSYRVSAVPTGATGKTGASASTRLTVLP